MAGWGPVGSRPGWGVSPLTPAVPRTSCAGATPPPARTVASAGRPTPSTAVSATAAGPASTVTCPVSPVRWPRGSKVIVLSRPGVPGARWAPAVRGPSPGPRRSAQASRSLRPRPHRHRRDQPVPERGPVHGRRQHAPLPLPGGLHRQLLRGPGGRVLAQPLPQRRHLHGLPWRLLLRGGGPSRGRVSGVCPRVPGPGLGASAGGTRELPPDVDTL